MGIIIYWAMFQISYSKICDARNIVGVARFVTIIVYKLFFFYNNHIFFVFNYNFVNDNITLIAYAITYNLELLHKGYEKLAAYKLFIWTGDPIDNVHDKGTYHLLPYL